MIGTNSERESGQSVQPVRLTDDDDDDDFNLSIIHV